MEILLCSTLCSKQSIAELNNTTGKDISGHTLQKYYRLIALGLIKNDINVSTASTIPISSCSNKWLSLNSDYEDGINFNYAKILNVTILRQLSIFISTIIIGLKWVLKNRKREKFVLVDVLNVSTSLGALFLKIFGIHVMGLVTDLPGLMVTDRGGIIKWIRRFNYRILSNYDSYVFLTEAMNSAINKKGKKYIVMEGLVDSDMRAKERSVDTNVKKIIYAGSLHEQYGIKSLVDGFMMVPRDDIRLLIFGGGPFSNKLRDYEKKDYRIKYYGLRPNTEIVSEELTATLLVNPRPTNEEFVKYSFPSKNMEYMVSGTPLLTTNLPGMPEEYKQYVYLLEEESAIGIKKVLVELFNDKSMDELNALGLAAKNFVLEKKNNIIQMKRVVALFKSAGK